MTATLQYAETLQFDCYYLPISSLHVVLQNSAILGLAIYEHLSLTSI